MCLFHYYCHHTTALQQAGLRQEPIAVLTDPLLLVIAGDVVPDCLLLPEPGGEGKAGLLLPLQQLQPLLPVVRLRDGLGPRVSLLVDLTDSYLVRRGQIRLFCLLSLAEALQPLIMKAMTALKPPRKAVVFFVLTFVSLGGVPLQFQLFFAP